MNLIRKSSNVRYILVAAGFVLCFASVPSFAQMMQPGHMGTPYTPGEQVAGRTVNLNMVSGQRETFFHETAKNSEMNGQLSQLALTQSSNAAIKEMAQQIIQEYPKMIAALNTVAQQSGVSFSGKLPKSFDKDKKKMQALTGPEFDKAYMKAIRRNLKNEQSACDQNSVAMNTFNLHQLLDSAVNSTTRTTQQVKKIESGVSVATK